MICKKCGNEVREDEKFCSKCGKRIKRDNKNTDKHKKWYIVISIIAVIIIIGVAVGIGINTKNNSNTIKDNQDSTIANKEMVIIDDEVIRGAKYNFTLEDVKRSMDNTCKQNNMNNYTDFEKSISETEVINYTSYKNEDNKKSGERIDVETIDNYVLSITFVYPDSVKNQNLSGSEDVFFNILKDNGEEEYANKIKSIITELPMNKNQYYNNTLCYKGYYEVDKATVYSISATSEKSYNEMKEGKEEWFVTEDNNTETNVNTDMIDKTTFINNLSEEDKKYLKYYLNYKFNFINNDNYVATEEDSFIEDRFDIIGNEIIYTYLQANKPRGWDNRAGGYKLIASYFSIVPIKDIPSNWKEEMYTDEVPNYIVVSDLKEEQVASLYGNGTTDEELDTAKQEANTKIEEQLNSYKELKNKSFSNEEKKALGELYLAYLYNCSNPELKKDEFSTDNLKTGSTKPKWDNNILDTPYDYCKILKNNKVLYIAYFKKAKPAQSYKEKDSSECYAVGCLIDVNIQNIPIYYRIQLEKLVSSSVFFESDIYFNDIATLIELNCVPKPVNTLYFETSTEEVYGGNDCDQVADKFINTICEHFGV